MNVWLCQLDHLLLKINYQFSRINLISKKIYIFIIFNFGWGTWKLSLTGCRSNEGQF